MTSVTNNIVEVLNNREKAILIWMILLIIIGASSSKIRKPIINVIKAFFAKKLLQIYCVMLVYVFLIVLLLNAIHIWEFKHFGLTIKWSVLVAFVMLFKFEKAKQPNYFKSALISNFKILVIIEFIVNLYVFSLPIEFILVPFLVMLGALTAIAETDEQYEPVKKLTNFLISSIGFIFLVYASYKAVTDFQNFVTVKNLENFYLPIILSIFFIPFVYLVSLYSIYETFFVRLGFFVDDPIVLKYAKRKTIWKININLWELAEWSKYINSNWRFKEKQEVDDAILVFTNREKRNGKT